MPKAIAFIDGFNLYHALDETSGSGVKPYNTYKWLDYWALGKRYTPPSNDLVAVYWFTAYVPWKSASGKAKKERHRKLVAVAKDSGVEVEWGKFRPVTRRCGAQCRAQYRTHEEKRTDVKIALFIHKLAYEDAYDTGIVISGDSDLVPAIEMASAVNARVSFVNVVPIGRSSAELSRLANVDQKHMCIQDLVACRLPNTVALRRGGRIDCPQEWR